jgi:hypothetical protein
MQPLTDDEAALLYHVIQYGSDGYPVEKSGRCWIVRDWRSVKGPPIVFKTKRAAVAQFEAWEQLALERLREMKRLRPGSILTAVGVLVH